MTDGGQLLRSTVFVRMLTMLVSAGGRWRSLLLVGVVVGVGMVFVRL